MSYNIQSMKIKEMQNLVESLGEKPFRGQQVFQWIHEKKVISYEDMTNIPLKLRNQLKNKYPLKTLCEVEKYEDIKDKTVKYLFKLEDGQLVETVLMQYKYGYSVCISSQVGCRMGCTFCASTLQGLMRQLEPYEMLEQVYTIERTLDKPVHSVVLMGTGEPFDNYNYVQRFIELISYEEGRHLSRRHITVSTCGLIREINKFSEELSQVNLAVSLHSPYQHQREKMMPIAKKNTMDKLMLACHRYVELTGRRISFEYSLIQGVNDTEQHAIDLGKLLQGLQSHVNLIPVNPVDEKKQKASTQRHVLRFKKILEDQNVNATIRRSLGQNIDAACGQLRNRYRNKN